MDAATKESTLKRLRRIEGQVRGLQRMVEEGRYCVDVVSQVASVQEALRGVARALVQNHMKTCVAQSDQPEAMYDELIEVIYKHLR